MLTEAQRKMMADIGTRRPVADNDDGWLSLSDCRRPTVWALVRAGMIEARHKGPITSGAQLHRITPAGLRALSETGVNADE